MKQTAQQNGNLLMYGKTDQVGSQVFSAVNAAEHAACKMHASPSHTCVLTFNPTLSFVDPLGF